MLASLHLRAGNLDRGSVVFFQHARVADGDTLIPHAEVHRVHAEILLANGECAEAETALLKELKHAERDGARLFQLRAANSLAALRRCQDRISDARDVLSPIYREFSEGFDQPDLKDAKALLEVLG